MRVLWLLAAFGILLGGSSSSAQAAALPIATGLADAIPSLSEPAFFGIRIYGGRGYGRRHRSRRAYHRRSRRGQVVSRPPAEFVGSPALPGPARARGDRSGWVDPPPRAP